MTVEIYTTQTCAYCVNARQLLNRHGLAYTEIDVGGYPDRLLDMVNRSGRRTVPQIFIDNSAVGGYSELADLLDNQSVA